MDARPLFAFTQGHGVATYPAGSAFGPRTLADCELVWIRDGSARWTCDGRTLAMPPGSVALARPGMRDAFAWDPARPTRHGFIHFRILRPPRGLPPLDRWPLLRTPDGGPLVPVLDHLVALLADRPAGWEAQAEEGLAFALRAFVSGRLAPGVGDGAPPHPSIDRLLDGLRRHWGDGPLRQPPLAALCRMAGASRVHLTRLCQRELGHPPVAAVRGLRLHAAAQLLATTSLPVQAIAERCAFASPFHLSRAFRAAYGHAPTVWRARMHERGWAPVTPLVRVAGRRADRRAAAPGPGPGR